MAVRRARTRSGDSAAKVSSRGASGTTVRAQGDPGHGDPGKGERTRLRLLRIAVRRFAERGFRHTSVSLIAREAHVTPAAAYAYFDSKEALFTAAVDLDAGELVEKARGDVSDGPLAQRWPGLVVALQTRLPEHPLARRVLAGREPEVIDRVLALPTVLALRADLVEEVRDGQTSGDVRGDLDASVLVLGLESIVLALLMGSVQTSAGEDAARSRATMQVLSAVLRGPVSRS